VIEDQFLGMKFPDAINVKRKVEINQWTETKKSIKVSDGAGGRITRDEYSYGMEWKEDLVNSSNFHVGGYNNPVNVPIKSEFWTNETRIYSLGVSGEILKKLDNLNLVKLRDETSNNFENIQKNLNFCDDYSLYIGKNPLNPEVGDMKVQFSSINAPVTVSIIAMKDMDNFLVPILNGNDSVSIIKIGLHSIKQLIESEENSNQKKAWLSRFGFWFLNWFAFLLIAGPLFHLAEFIPFFYFVFATKTFFSTLYTSLKLSFIVILLAQDLKTFAKIAIVLLLFTSGLFVI